MFDSLSLGIVCSFKLTVFLELRENCSLCETDNVRGHISEHIFAPNGGDCLFLLPKKKKIHSGGATEFQGKIIKYIQCPPSSLSADIVIIEKLLTLRRFFLPFEALHFKVLVMKYRVSRTFFPCSCFLLFFLSISLEPYTSPTNFYKELPNSDFPSLHDYGCSNSRLFDACQLAVYDVTEAKYKCDWDDRCKAFVTTARTLWTGEWRQSPR